MAASHTGPEAAASLIGDGYTKIKDVVSCRQAKSSASNSPAQPNLHPCRHHTAEPPVVIMPTTCRQAVLI
jgi:hypothetical protein